MLENLPVYIAIVFGLTTVATLLLFYWVIRNSNIERKTAFFILIGSIDWLILQAVLTYIGIYNSSIEAMPPKILVFGIAPMLLFILFLFIRKSGRNFIDQLSIKHLTYLHVIRVPVEIVLLWLFMHKAIPQLMTFEGRNFDILAGITAPIIAYVGLTKGNLSKQIILLWNFICLGLLLNIVINAVLAAPFAFQRFAFDQPNIAIFYFPFSWLPTFVVPLVLFSHLVTIKQLLKK
ncbi:hypothetical protein ACQ33O_09295 [Ferruginibacter sp. SUN002]|uniref:hypothetical protein n=1 Tax=Ferruginibacter sp. SUN002 TaxID=2937789 RepID=UPI003D35F969